LFTVGNEIKRGSRVGNLATEIKRTRKDWPITEKDLLKNKTEIIIVQEEDKSSFLCKCLQELSYVNKSE
jgi:hypothetical protein